MNKENKMTFMKNDDFKLTMQPGKFTIFKRQNVVIQFFRLLVIGFKILKMAFKH